MAQNYQNPRKLTAAVRALRPVFELTPHIRPRLLIAAILPADRGTILFGILVHRERQAFQSRLRFHYPTGHREVLRATRWTPLPDPHAFTRHLARVIEGFETMAATLGGTTRKVEVAPTASDEEVLEGLRASGILEVLR